MCWMDSKLRLHAWADMTRRCRQLLAPGFMWSSCKFAGSGDKLSWSGQGAVPDAGQGIGGAGRVVLMKEV
jgi:hypothetical protein